MASIPAALLPNDTPLYQGVWVVAPSVGKHRTEFTLAMLNMSAPINTNCGVYMPIGMKVDEARNIFAQAAIDNNVKYIMFIDEDVLVAPHTMRRLYYWLEQFEDLDAVGGVYCAKDPADPDAKPFPLVFRGDGAGAFWDWRYGEFFEVTGLGMGCTMIRVEALKKLAGPWFLTQRYTENIRDKKTGDITGRHHFVGTEDLYFFRRLREESGGKIFCDGSLVFEHIDTEGKKYSLPPDCKILRPNTHNGKAFGNQGKCVLNLGCGTMYDIFEEGIALRVDLREEANPDYRADLRNLPFEDEFADVVFSSHTLEHFGRWEQEEVLKEWIRVLKPGGILRLVVPNLKWAAEQIIKYDGITGNPAGRDVLDVLYGEQNYKLNYHQFGFTKDLLRSICMTYGIEEPLFSETGYALVMEARKKGTFVDPVQESMRKKVKTWIRTSGAVITPDGQPVDPEKPGEKEEPSVDAVIRGWTMDQAPKAFSCFWDPNRRAAVVLAGLTRQVETLGYFPKKPEDAVAKG